MNKLSETERKILRSLESGSKTTKNLERELEMTYQGVRKACMSLEEQDLVSRTNESRNYRWYLSEKSKNVVSNGNTNVKNLPVSRDYNFQNMVPSDVKEFVDPFGLMDKIRAIMFKTSILMEGDTGSGKTESIRRLAEEENMPFYTIQGTPDTRVEDLIGFPMQLGDNTIWVDGIIPKVLMCSQKRKCILFIDEINRLETNVQSVFFPLLDDRCSCVIHERGGEVIRGNKDNLAVIATANIGTQHYVNPLDKAFLDRFDIIKIDYLDSTSEIELLKNRCGIYNDLAERMVDVANSIRRSSENEQQRIEKGLSTRRLLRWANIATVLSENGIKNPLMKAGEMVVINHYSGEDEIKVRNIVEHLKGVSMDEVEQKKRDEEYKESSSDDEDIDIDKIMEEIENL